MVTIEAGGERGYSCPLVPIGIFSRNVRFGTLHELDVHGRLDALETLLQLARHGFPTSIRREGAAAALTPEAIHWLTEHNVIVARDDDRYGLVDEFLRIRMIMDSEKSEVARAKIEERLLYRDRRDEADDELSFEEDAG